MEEAEQDSDALAGKRVVIVEDEGITQIYLSRILRQQGLIIAGQAYNGQEGVEMVLRERPDIVLMDLRMPGMNGVEAASRILTVYPVCIMFLTAQPDAFTQEQAEQAGACGYIRKPVDRTTLLDSISKVYQACERKTQRLSP